MAEVMAGDGGDAAGESGCAKERRGGRRADSGRRRGGVERMGAELGWRRALGELGDGFGTDEDNGGDGGGGKESIPGESSRFPGSGPKTASGLQAAGGRKPGY